MPHRTSYPFWVLPLAICSLQFPSCPPAFADPPVVSFVRVEGAKALRSRDLLGGFETAPGQTLDSLALRRDVDRILGLCRSEGLYLAEVDFPRVEVRNHLASVLFRLREGPRIRIGRLTISAPETIGPPFRLESRPGQAFRPGVLERDMEAVIGLYENAGYPYCAIYPTVGAPSGDGDVDVSLRVEEGPFIRVGALRVLGGGSTRPSVVERTFDLRPGTPYDQRRVDRGQRALIQSGLFESVGDISLVHDPERGTADLSLRVVEGKANQIDGVVGYVPGSEGQKGYLAGLMDLSFRNLEGTGRSASVRWARKGPGSSDVSMGYLEPWIGTTRLSGEFRFDLRQRSGYVASQVALALRLPLAGGFRAECQASWEQVSPDSAGIDLSPRTRTWRGTGGVSIDTRNDPLNPRSGGFCRASGSLGRAFLTASRQGVNRYRAEVDAEGLLPVLRSQALVLSAHARGIRTGEPLVPLSEKVRLGGASDLRGYREEQFAGDRALWGGLEHRLVMGRSSRALVFVDAGVISDRVALGGRIRRTSLFRVGYGAGLRAESRAGIVGLDFGFGQDDGLLQGKVHVRMVHRF